MGLHRLLSDLSRVSLLVPAMFEVGVDYLPMAKPDAFNHLRIRCDCAVVYSVAGCGQFSSRAAISVS
jgi:hypothetical protein